MDLERTLTRRELNRALLARQHLLERTEATVPRALERLGGLQAQYAPSMYIGLWSRLVDFPRESLTRLLERGTVVQATLMRVTIHLVARRDFWPFALATRDARRKLWLTSRRGALSQDDMAEAAEILRPRLADGPLRRTDIEQLVGNERASSVGLWIDLVRVPPAGTWARRRADLYGLAESKGHIALEPFGHLDRGAERDLREEAERLAEFHS